MGRLDAKLALVTGGNSGIGLATAKRFVNEGAYVFTTGRRNSELTTAVKEIGHNVTGVQGDVSNLGDLDRLFTQIKQEKGRLDIVFANAGIAKYARCGEIHKSLHQVLRADVDNRFKGPPHSRKCSEPRYYRYPRIERTARFVTGRRAAQEDDFDQHSARPVRYTR